MKKCFQTIKGVNVFICHLFNARRWTAHLLISSESNQGLKKWNVLVWDFYMVPLRAGGFKLCLGLNVQFWQDMLTEEMDQVMVFSNEHDLTISMT